jgi:hypothetical protein
METVRMRGAKTTLDAVYAVTGVPILQKDGGFDHGYRLHPTGYYSEYQVADFLDSAKVWPGAQKCEKHLGTIGGSLCAVWPAVVGKSGKKYPLSVIDIDEATSYVLEMDLKKFFDGEGIDHV